MTNDERNETREKVDEVKRALDCALTDDEKVVVVTMTGNKNTMSVHIVNADPLTAQEMLRVALMHMEPTDPEILRKAH